MIRLEPLCICALVVIPILSSFRAEAQALHRTAPPSASKAQFEHGKQLLEQKKYPEAAAEFNEVLKTAPGSPLLYNLLGFCVLQQDHLEEAVAHFKKAIQLKPDYKAAHNNLGGIYLIIKDYHEAMKEFSALILIDPKDTQAFLNLARVALALNDKEAVDHLRKASELSPGNVPVTVALAKLYLEKGEKGLAQPLVRGLSKATPQDASTELEIGKLLLACGQEDDARLRFQNALRANPSLQEVVFVVAADKFKKQNYSADSLFLDDLKTNMQASAAWHGMMGYSAFKLGNPARAVQEIQKAMELDPHNEDYVLELSEVFVTHNNAAAAVTLMETACKVLPLSARTWFCLGTAYLADQKRSAAQNALKKSLELDPTLDLAYVVLGQGYKEAGSWNQLQEAAEQLIKLSPQNFLGYYYKALALQSDSASKDIKDGEIQSLLHRSLELNPTDSDTHYELAKILLREGKKEASMLELENIIHTNPDFAPAYYQLARLYRERGQLEKSNKAQETHERIRQKERDKVMTRMIVEIQQRTKK